MADLYLLMLKSGGRRTHLVILRGSRGILDLLLDVGHSPVVPDHVFAAGTGHHTNLRQSKKTYLSASTVVH